MELQRIFTLITTVVETALFTGVVYGWASINPVLVQEGYFASACPSPNSTQSESCQQERLSLVFSIASSIPPVLTSVSGLMLDRFGAWLSRSVFLSVSLAGYLLTAVSTARTSWLLYLSVTSIAVGGYSVMTFNLQSGNLFPRARASVVTLISGSFDSASVVFLVIARLHAVGTGFNAMFYAMAAGCALLHVRTFVLTPKGTVPYVLPNRYRYGYRELRFWRKSLAASGDAESIRLSPDASNRRRSEDEENPDARSFRACLREPYTWTNVVHFCLCQFRITYFIGSFNLWLSSFGIRQNELDNYTMAFGVLQCFGIALAPLSGMVIDFCRKKFSKRLPENVASLKAVAVAFVLTDSIFIIMSITSLISNLPLQYLTFGLQVLGRSTFYGLSSAFVSVIYPSQHFGVFNALPVWIGGVFLLLQFPLALLVSRVFKNDFTAVNVVLLVLTVFAAIHPITLFREVHKKCTRTIEIQPPDSQAGQILWE